MSGNALFADWVSDKRTQTRIQLKGASTKRVVHWSGGRNAAGEASGPGTLQILFDGQLVATYTGEMRAGRMDGTVEAVYQKTRQRYVGELANWDENGRGTMWYPDGSIKRGIWRDGELIAPEPAAAAALQPSASTALEDVRTQITQADTELTATYQRALKVMPAGMQEHLRKAERAWIVFTDKTNAQFALTAHRNGWPREFLLRSGLGEIRARTRELKLLAESVPNDSRSRGDLIAAARAADRELTEVYERCADTLPPPEREKLRDAQRVWITYRDANDIAMNSLLSRNGDVLALLLLTNRRLAELRDFHLGNHPEAPAATPADEMAANVRQMAAIAQKEMAGFESEVTALAQSGLAAGKWTDPSTLDQLAPLAPEWVASAEKLLARWTRLSVSAAEQATQAACLAGIRSVRMALAYSKVASAFKNSDAAAANETARAALLLDPKAPEDAGGPLHKALSQTAALLEDQSAKAKEHLIKASSFAKLGKSADAIREYQAAYAIFPDPKVPVLVEKLRAESLGL